MTLSGLINSAKQGIQRAAVRFASRNLSDSDKAICRVPGARVVRVPHVGLTIAVPAKYSPAPAPARVKRVTGGYSGNSRQRRTLRRAALRTSKALAV